MRLLIDRIVSPIGTILLVSDGQCLRALDFADCEDRVMRWLRARHGDVGLIDADDPQGFSSRMRAYFSGRHDACDDVPVETGGTPFQQRVWTALREIPAGATATYGALARRLGKPTGSRAVGAANALNPVAIVIPCHRLVGASGALTGYAGGLDRKRWLLEHEGALSR